MQLDHKNIMSLILDISAAFDTIDHDILITRLSSWFGIHGCILNWFKSYLSSRYFRVKCSNRISSSRTSSCGIYQSSVLGPILFIMYTTPDSTKYAHLNHSTITCIQTTHSSSSLSTHPIFTLASPTSRLLYKKFLLG